MRALFNIACWLLLIRPDDARLMVKENKHLWPFVLLFVIALVVLFTPVVLNGHLDAGDAKPEAFNMEKKLFSFLGDATLGEDGTYRNTLPDKLLNGICGWVLTWFFFIAMPYFMWREDHGYNSPGDF